jgi:microcystin-dependent protein
MEGTVGEIRLFAATFAPRNWSYCDGSLIQIRSNTALFSILGTSYGGNGTVTFGLPNLKGRTVIGSGQAPGLSLYELGETVGSNSVVLTTAEMPNHTHVSSALVTIPAYSDEGNQNTPTNNLLASKASMYNSEIGDTNMKAAPFTVTLSSTGGNQPISLTQPTIGMNYIICMYGTFPSRN